MRTDHGDSVYLILRSHIGLEQAITAPEICSALAWPPRNERVVREIIRDEAAFWDALVCAVPGTGYFCAATFDEICAYENWLSALASEASQKRDRFRELCARLGFHFYHERSAA
jgi:hypothetical protein